jgi:hypothetical protein
MKFANPFRVDCSACGETARYDPKHLLTLNANCVVCGASLRATGLRMREQIEDCAAFVARIEIALELENSFGIQIQDIDLERIQMPLEFVTLVSALTTQVTQQQVATQILSALAHARQMDAHESDLHRNFAELFSVREDG